MPATYVTEPFDVARGDRCEVVFNVKVERKLKRKLDAEQAGQPLKKKRKTKAKLKLTKLILLRIVMLLRTLLSLSLMV